MTPSLVQLDESTIIIVRPDGHVAKVIHPGGPQTLSALEKQCREAAEVVSKIGNDE